MLGDITINKNIYYYYTINVVVVIIIILIIIEKKKRRREEERKNGVKIRRSIHTFISVRVHGGAIQILYQQFL